MQTFLRPSDKNEEPARIRTLPLNHVDNVDLFPRFFAFYFHRIPSNAGILVREDSFTYRTEFLDILFGWELILRGSANCKKLS